MRLQMTRRTDYAVRAMLALARHPDQTLSSTDIAEMTGIPVRFVTQVMGHLVRAGLVRGVIGRSGGYRLATTAEAVSVLAIVDAVETDARRPQCVLRGERHAQIHRQGERGEHIGEPGRPGFRPRRAVPLRVRIATHRRSPFAGW